uniref:Thioredoxin domain-containing protein n=1 Tax=Tetradesmus obliquus TaxID=3088 RepID=A0A383WFG8_TETOB|eukprot:jgi/Sobl393_1/11336/SZX76325.1
MLAELRFRWLRRSAAAADAPQTCSGTLLLRFRRQDNKAQELSQATAESFEPGVLVADVADVADGAAEPQQQQQQQPQQQTQQQQQQTQQQQWWQADEGNWLELTSPTELLSFISAVQPPPAWPALADGPAPKLKLIEFYARWCGACAAAAPGMAAAASEPQLQASATFARVNVDRVKPLMKQLGISRIPTVMLLAPDGRLLDTFRASGDAARDAILQHSQALARARAEGQPPAAAAPPAVPLHPAPEQQGEEEVPLDGSNGSSGTSAGSSSSGVTGSEAKEACGLTPEPACTAPPQPAAGPAAQPGSSAAEATASAAAALQQAKQQFLAQYGAGYGYGGWLDAHYEAEVGARLGQGHHYLDYTGAALYPSSLLQSVYADLLAKTYGNPHSAAAASTSPEALSSGAASGGSSSSGTRVGPAAASEAVMEQAALAVLSHLNADPAEYQVVFTRSATEALKLVGELFPWTAAGSSSSGSGGTTPSEADMLSNQQQKEGLAAGPTSSSSNSSSSGSSFIYTRSNHNSVLGVGAYAAAAGAELVPLTDQQMDDWMAAAAAAAAQPQQQQPQQQLQGGASQGSRWQLPWQAKQQDMQPQAPAQSDQQQPVNEHQQQQQQQQGPRYHLIAYPAQDNYAGVVYPLDYINKAHAASTATDRYLVLLDAAAFLPSHPLDLSVHPADFVAASFYKLFGYPTGLGALVLRSELVPALRKVYFGGGSVALATPEGCWHVAKCDPGAALSDGTPNYLGAAALSLAYDSWDSRGGMQAVEEHTQALRSWLYEQLSSLQHSNGTPLLQVYGRHAQEQQQQGGQVLQGAIFNFQVLQPDGSPLSFSRVERQAAAAGIDLRSGCVCNPGACYDSLGLSAGEVQGLAGLKEGCGDGMDFITVLRPAESSNNSTPAAAAATLGGVAAGRADTGSSSSGSGAVSGQQQQQQQQLVEVQVPLGSVRASLGWASTFEDAYALVQFLKGYLQ